MATRSAREAVLRRRLDQRDLPRVHGARGEALEEELRVRDDLEPRYVVRPRQRLWVLVEPYVAVALEKRQRYYAEKLEALGDYAKSALFTDAEKVAFEYADAIIDTRRDVDDELFARVRRRYDDDTIAELTMIIAWENASSRFNRAFRIPSQGFWKP